MEDGALCCNGGERAGPEGGHKELRAVLGISQQESGDLGPQITRTLILSTTQETLEADFPPEPPDQAISVLWDFRQRA